MSYILNKNANAELWDLYNEHRTKTLLTHERGKEIPDGYYHLVVHVWIKNSHGQYLIARRSAKKETYPLMWECPGGAALKGENSMQAAVRKVREELGIDLSHEFGELVCTRLRKEELGVKFNEIMDVWLFTTDCKFRPGEASPYEVADAKWLTPEQIEELFFHGEMVQTLDYFFTHIEKKNNLEI